FLCYRFVTYLESSAEKNCPPQALERLAKEKGMDETQAAEQAEALKQCLLIRLVDLATKEVARFLYAPFTIILLLVIAQSSIFENWHWNLPIILTTLLNAAVALSCAWMLQRSAKHAKDKALEALDKLIVVRVGIKKDSTYAKLNRIKDDIDGLQSGAFGGFLQNPVVKAVLIPLGGSGGLAALEALMVFL
ncbi:MAG TPA: hypothetical protein VGY58_05100, partial [Gemmataceae bacterium]|nr:hypothetical protein [Gemmataceae bacterium]